MTAVCCRASGDSKARKSAFVIGAPLVLTTLAYAVFDRSKFQGYSANDRPLLSNWGGGGFGAVNFSRLRDDSERYCFYVVRTAMSIVINICSVMLVLGDAVGLEVRQDKALGWKFASSWTVLPSSCGDRCISSPDDGDYCSLVRSLVGVEILGCACDRLDYPTKCHPIPHTTSLIFCLVRPGSTRYGDVFRKDELVRFWRHEEGAKTLLRI